MADDPARTGAGAAGADGEGKAKKPRPPPPVPPPAVGTASLLIRGAAARVLGLRPGPCGGELQPLWATEPDQGKVTVSLEGCARALPKDEQHRALLDAIEAAVNELVAANAAVSVFEMSRAAAEAQYGDGIYDGRSAAGDALRLAYVPGAALAEVPTGWSLCATAGACGAVRFIHGEEGSKKKPDTLILAKKKQMMIRYQVAAPGAPGAPLGGRQPSAEEARELDAATVRVAVPGVDGVDGASESPKAKGREQEKEQAAGVDEEEMEVNPWEVKGKIDYEKLVRDFGTKLLTKELLSRMEAATVGQGRVPRLHRWIRRGIFFSHRDLDLILNCADKGLSFYLYTGRGPSSAAMHLGHLIPFLMTKWLQDAFDVPLVIQMTDDEKFLWKGEYDEKTGDNLMHYRHLTTENAKDIIACGFDKKKTFIFSDLDYVGHMYPNIVRVWKAITYNTARSLFGFQGDNNIGQSAFPAIQAVPSFPSSFPVPLRGQNKMACLIPCAIDQDNYFRATRDIAHKLVPSDHPLKGKPALLHAKFFPPLQGAQGKMSASNESSAVFLTDTPDQIESKIKKYAFSGGQQFAKDQREKGADLDLDVSYQWLRFFLEDDEELAKIGREYGSGQGDYWNTGSVKDRLINLLQELVAEHQVRRAKITDEEVAEWMRVRPLEF